MKTTLRALGTIAACLTLALSVAGCGGGAGSDGTVTIGMVSRTTMTWAPQLAAEGQGYLDAELGAVDRGWKVTEFPGGGPMTTALASGDVDFALLPMAAVVALNAQNRDLRCVFTPSTGSAVVIVAAKKYEAERGRDIAAFDGARWGYSSEGSTGRVVLEQLAENAGLRWDRQHGVAIGSAAANEPALAGDRVDILSSDPVSAQAAVDSGEGYVVVNTNDPADPAWRYAQSGVCLATSARMIAEHPDVVQALVNAERRGLVSVQGASGRAEDVIKLFPEPDGGNGWTPAEWRLVAPSFVTAGKPADDTVYSVTGELTRSLYGVALDDRVVRDTFDNTFVARAGA